MSDPTPKAGITHDLVLEYGDPNSPTRIGLMLPGGDVTKYAIEPYTPFAPQSRQGEATIRDFGIASTWELNQDWKGGMPHTKEAKVETNTYAYARGNNVTGNIGTTLFTGMRGRILPAPAHVSAGTITNFKQFITHGGKLYGLTSDATGKVYEFDAAGTATTLKETLTGAGYQLFTNGTKLYATQGTSGFVRSSTDGTTWANEAFQAHFIAARGDGTLAYITSATLTPGGTYAATGVGFAGTVAAGMAYYQGALWIGKPEGLYVWYNGTVEQRVDTTRLQDASNFTKLVPHLDLIYFNVANRLYFSDGKGYTEIIPKDPGGFTSITALESTFGNLLIGAKVKPKQGYSTATNATSPGTAANVGSYIAWSSPNNAKASDDAYSTIGLSIMGLFDTSDWLRLTNYGFSIPSAAVINGIKVEIECASNALAGMHNIEAQLVNSGSAIGTAQTIDLTGGKAEAYRTLGGVSDTWGATLTQAIVAGSTFGVQLRVNNNGAPSGTVSVDHVRITVYYAIVGAEHNYILLFESPNEAGLNPLWSDADGTNPIYALYGTRIYANTQTRVYFCSDHANAKTRYIDLNERMYPKTFDVVTNSVSYLDLTDFSAGFRAVPKWFYQVVLTVDNPTDYTYARVFYSIDGNDYVQCTDDTGTAATIQLNERTKGVYIPVDTVGNWCQLRVYMWTTTSTDPSSITTITLRGAVMVKPRYRITFPVDCSPTVPVRQGNAENGQAIRDHIRAAASQNYPVKLYDFEGNCRLVLFQPPSPLEAIRKYEIPDIRELQTYPIIQMVLVEIDPLDSDGSFATWRAG